jgi:hypothetical protein
MKNVEQEKRVEEMDRGENSSHEGKKSDQESSHEGKKSDQESSHEGKRCLSVPL